MNEFYQFFFMVIDLLNAYLTQMISDMWLAESYKFSWITNRTACGNKLYQSECLFQLQLSPALLPPVQSSLNPLPLQSFCAPFHWRSCPGCTRRLTRLWIIPRWCGSRQDCRAFPECDFWRENIICSDSASSSHNKHFSFREFTELHSQLFLHNKLNRHLYGTVSHLGTDEHGTTGWL